MNNNIPDNIVEAVKLVKHYSDENYSQCIHINGNLIADALSQDARQTTEESRIDRVNEAVYNIQIIYYKNSKNDIYHKHKEDLLNAAKEIIEAYDSEKEMSSQEHEVKTSKNDMHDIYNKSSLDLLNAINMLDYYAVYTLKYQRQKLKRLCQSLVTLL